MRLAQLALVIHRAASCQVELMMMLCEQQRARCLHVFRKKPRAPLPLHPQSFFIQFALSYKSELFAFVNREFFTSQIFSSHTAAELLAPKTLQKVSNANDFDCMDPRPRNHMSPNLRYIVKFIS